MTDQAVKYSPQKCEIFTIRLTGWWWFRLIPADSIQYMKNERLHVVQIAYLVNDIRASALKAVERYGAGPFFINENIELSWAEHRGEPANFIHSSAYGQWGPLMIEFVQQEDDSTNTPYRDLFQKGEEGLHHMAIVVDDMDEAINHFESQGMPLATRAKTLQGGADFGFIDATKSLGHMIEIYPDAPGLRDFYDRIKQASVDWDGDNPLRSPEELFR